MSTVLSPAEQQEVTRFGIHDDDALRDMDAAIEDVPVCHGEDNPAAAVARMRCCGMSFLICDHHIELSRQLLVLGRRLTVFCESCGADVTRCTFDEAVDLVPL